MVSVSGCGDGASPPDVSDEPAVVGDAPGRRDAYWELFPAFSPFVQSGVGDGEVDLPTGAWAGTVEVVSSGGGAFGLWEVDDRGVPLTTLVNAAADYSGTVPFGLDGLEGAARLVVRTEGPWTATIGSVRDAPALPDGDDGDGVYWNTDEGRDVTWSFPADGVFKVVTYPEYALPELKHYVIPRLDHPDAAPGAVATRQGHVATVDSLVVVSSGGAWTVS